MKTRIAFFKYSLCLFGLIYAGYASAQKLPNIQENSQWLPETAQIDGKLSEWNGSLQAYNKATLVEYTIANDDKNLYLAVKSKDKTTTAKILAGGITFRMNTSGNNTNEGAIVTVPATNSASYFNTEGRGETRGGLSRNFETLSDSADIRNAIVGLKEIKAIRLKDVSDSILSVYNEYGIKSKLAYTNETLICELSIPFDRINLSAKESVDVAYSITLNGVPVPPARRPPSTPIPGQRITPPVVLLPGSINERDIGVVTYFDGKYTLAKKQFR